MIYHVLELVFMKGEENLSVSHVHEACKLVEANFEGPVTSLKILKVNRRQLNIETNPF